MLVTIPQCLNDVEVLPEYNGGALKCTEDTVEVWLPELEQINIRLTAMNDGFCIWAFLDDAVVLFW